MMKRCDTCGLEFDAARAFPNEARPTCYDCRKADALELFPIPKLYAGEAASKRAKALALVQARDAAAKFKAGEAASHALYREMCMTAEITFDMYNHIVCDRCRDVVPLMEIGHIDNEVLCMWCARAAMPSMAMYTPDEWKRATTANAKCYVENRAAAIKAKANKGDK